MVTSQLSDRSGRLQLAIHRDRCCGNSPQTRGRAGGHHCATCHCNVVEDSGNHSQQIYVHGGERSGGQTGVLSRSVLSCPGPLIVTETRNEMEASNPLSPSPPRGIHSNTGRPSFRMTRRADKRPITRPCGNVLLIFLNNQPTFKFKKYNSGGGGGGTLGESETSNVGVWLMRLD